VVGTRLDGEFTWIEARPEWAPSRTLREYGSAVEVEKLQVPPPGEWVYAWAWEDVAAGRVRARGFPGRNDGIEEDEATGAAALLLTAHLRRALNITQGKGSQILTAPQPEGLIEVGGRVRLA
jgi:predicted PhzF superfamily epimerase YddE/YHI9